MVKQKLAMVVGVIATLVLAFGGTASAHNDDDHGWAVTVNHNPVSWTLTWEQCPNLPRGIALTGDGWEVFTSKTKIDPRGVTHLQERSEKSGSVVDNAGNTYRFDYLNTTRSTSSDGANFTGIMHDIFSVTGKGPGTVHNGFVARIEFDTTFSYFRANPISQFGNPFQFPSGPGICDPI
ncbi:MAG: hypothetical protein ABI658_13970 [Acidimicrobiales bacterium]